MPADIQRIIKFTAPAAGDHDIPVPADWLHKDEIAESFMPKADFSTELDRRVGAITKDLKKPDELLKDDDFMKKLATSRKADLLTFLNVVPNKNVEELQAQITERLTSETITPLKEQLTASEQLIESLKESTLEGAVATATSKPGQTAAPGLGSLITLFVKGKTRWSPEHKKHLVMKEDGTGFEFSGDPKKNGGPYMGIDEYIAKLSRDKETKGWFVAGTQAGPGFSGGPSDTKTLTLDQFEKMSGAARAELYQSDPETYTRLQEERRVAGEAKLFARA